MIMTTNNPEKLDDALVRAGRISVRVGFNKASKKQAEEIFLRMYVDQPSSKEDPTAAEEKTTAISNQETSPMRDFARQFAANIPDHEFSPADLQDYLLMHKKDAAAAVREIKGWMEEQYEERRRKEDEKDVEREMKREAKKEERRRFRDEIKKAVNADDTDDENENEQDDRKGADKGSDEEKFEEVRQSDEQIVKQDGEAAAS
jgi:chaperone BCS1